MDGQWLRYSKFAGGFHHGTAGVDDLKVVGPGLEFDLRVSV